MVMQPRERATWYQRDFVLPKGTQQQVQRARSRRLGDSITLLSTCSGVMR